MKSKAGVFGRVNVFAFLVIIIVILVGCSAEGEMHNSEEPNQANDGVTEASSYYIDMGYTYNLYPYAITDATVDELKYSLILQGEITQSYAFLENDNDPQGSKVAEIKISNFNITPSPQLGHLKEDLYGVCYDPTIPDYIPMNYDDGELYVDISHISQEYNEIVGTMRFLFEIIDVDNYTFSTDYDGTINPQLAYEKAGISSDQLRLQLNYDIEITCFNGNVFKSRVEIEPLQGNFLYDDSLQFVDNSLYDYSEGKPFRE